MCNNILLTYFFIAFNSLSQLPKELNRPDSGYDHRESMFGFPPYGDVIEQNVYYANTTLCDPNVDYSRGGYPSRTKDATKTMAPWEFPFILMVDRGDCTFVFKVRNAQKAGATAVLIADDSCVCDMGDGCVSDGKRSTCYASYPVLNDDGSGADIAIPTFLIFKEDADLVKQFFKNDTVVRAEMSWKLPHTSSRVEYELWTTPVETTNAAFKKSFRKIAVALGEYAQFTPHFYFYDGAWQCINDEGKSECDSHCTSDGQYCATDQDDLDNGITGGMVITESLRQICIWRLYGADGIGLSWWKYIEEFEFRCDNDDDGTLFGSETCVKEAMERSGVDYDKVSSCMKTAGGIGAGVENRILEKELYALDAREKEGDFMFPSVFVNQSPLKGALTTNVVFAGICAGFIAGSEPPICKLCHKCIDINLCVLNGFCPGRGSTKTTSFRFFAGSMVCVVGCFSILAFFQWPSLQRKMRAEVKVYLAAYTPSDNIPLLSMGVFNKDYTEKHEQTIELS